MRTRTSRLSPSGWNAVLCLICTAALGVAGAYQARSPRALRKEPGGPSGQRAAGRAPHPLYFEANQGQTDSRVRFLSRGSGYSLFLTPGEVVLSLGSGSPPAAPPTPRNASHTGVRRSGTGAHGDVLRMKLVNGNPHPSVQGREEQPGKVHYLVGNDPARWRRFIPTYAGVQYQAVYPGVDLLYYGNRENELEHDFVVQPGADPDLIAVRYEGQQGAALDAQGDLVLHTRHGDVRQRRPVVYQEGGAGRQSIAGGYVLRESADGEAVDVSFRVGEYDRQRPLIIDPVLSLSTYLGTAGNETATAIDVAAGFVVVGNTTSASFPADNLFHGGPTDAFVVYRNVGEEVVYSIYLGGSQRDSANGVAFDDAGHVLVAGTTNSPDFPRVNVSSTDPPPAGFNVFVVRILPDGSGFAYAYQYGGSGDENLHDLALTPDQRLCLVGSTSSLDFLTFGNAVPAGGGLSDGFLTVVEGKSPKLLYSTRIGGNGNDGADGVAVPDFSSSIPPLSSIVVVGRVTSRDFLTRAANGQLPIQRSLGTPSGPAPGDGFVARFDLTTSDGGGLRYATYFGGSSEDSLKDAALDSGGNAVVVGQSASSDFPRPTVVGSGSILRTTPRGQDLLLAKINPEGTRVLYSGLIGQPGASGTERARAVDVDAVGVVWIAGDTDSTDFPVVNPVQSTHRGVVDAVVLAVSSDTSRLLFSTYLGGAFTDQPAAMEVTGPSTRIIFGREFFFPAVVYLTGTTSSPDFPVASPYQATYSGGSDAFIVTIKQAVGAGLSSLWRKVRARHRSTDCVITGRLEVENPGIFATPPTQTRVYLSEDAVLDAEDELLSRLHTPSVRAGRTRVLFFGKVTRPCRGRYLIAVADAIDRVKEPNEVNNVAVFGPL
jgi:hypothetical protein